MEPNTTPAVLNGKSTSGYDTATFVSTDGYWNIMDDNVMGGRSSSRFTVKNDAGSKYIDWKGNLVRNGGGFCSV